MLTLRVIGSDFRLSSSDPDTLDRLARLWHRCVVTDAGRVGSVDLPIDEQKSDYALASRITTTAVENMPNGMIAFHAGGIADDEGRVVALLGPSGAGKSTATAALAQRDFGYVSDEAVVVSEHGTVSPFPRPLGQVRSQVPGAHKVLVSPDELGLRSCPSPLRIAGLVVLDRSAQTSESHLAPLGLIDGVLALIPHTSGLGGLPRPLVTLCSIIARCGGVHRMRYSSTADVAPQLRALLARPHAAQLGLVLGDPDAENAVMWALRDGRIRRSPYRDAVKYGEEALVMIGRRPVRLSGIGLTIWDASGDGVTLDELTSLVVSVHGPHPDASGLVANAVAEMCKAEVLATFAPVTVRSILAGDCRGAWRTGGRKFLLA